MLKKICFILIVLACFFAIGTGCSSEKNLETVSNEPVTITYLGAEYEGIYSGEIRKGKPNGKGIFVTEGYTSKTNEDNRTGPWNYDGEWKKGNLHGEGVLSFDFGSRYEGTFDTGLLQGFGRYYEKDVLVYEGEWLNDEPHGEGKLYNSKTGAFRYEGQFRYGKPVDL